MQEFTLIKSEDVPLAAVAANQMAVELDLIATAGRIVELSINGSSEGAYYMVEKVKKSYLKRKHGFTQTSILANEGDWDRKDNLLRNSPHMSDQDLFHGHLEADQDKYHKYAIARYKSMVEELDKENGELLLNYFDIEYMGKFLALTSIFNDVHFMSGDNLKLIYNHKNGKFYPLFRKETGVNVFDTKVWAYKDLFKYNFPNYNSIMFECQPDAKDALNLRIFKELLAEDKVRYARDKVLNKLVIERESIIKKVMAVYAQNKSILLADNFSRRAIEIEEFEATEWMKRLLNLAGRYLDYARVYGSYDEHENVLEFVCDAYQPIQVLGVDLNGNFDGIGFNADLNLYYRYHRLPLGELSFKDLVFVHMGDTLSKDQVLINLMSSENVDYKEQIEKN